MCRLRLQGCARSAVDTILDSCGAATRSDHGGVYDAVSLSRTSSDTDKIVAYDLDSIDWLSDGGLFWIENADIVWMDDEA